MASTMKICHVEGSMRNSTRFVVVALLAAFLVGMTGCAGSRTVMRVEEGYAPTHIAVGEIIAYTQGQGMIKQNDLVRLITQYMEDAFYQYDVRFVKARDLDEPGVLAEDLALLDIEVTFLPTSASSGTPGPMDTEDSFQSSSGSSNNYDLRYTYTLKRRSDHAVVLEGSAKSTDASVSTGGSLDMESAIQFAANATAKKVKAQLAGTDE